MSKSRIAEKIAFIGGGQMAEALIAGLVATRCCEPDQIWATDPVAQRCEALKRLHGVRVGSSNRDAAAWAGIIVLAVKPQNAAETLPQYARFAGKVVFLSIMAGRTMGGIQAKLCEALGELVTVLPARELARTMAGA